MHCRNADANAVQYDHLYSSTKRRRLDNDLDDWKDDYADDAETARQDDVDNYVALRLNAEQTNSFQREVDGEPTFDITKFWLDPSIQTLLPRLSRVAIGVLSVPASSASSERIFSTAGRVLEKRRCQLSSSSVDALVFMHSQHHAHSAVNA